MSTGMPELGSKISLISKADIRYEGHLFTVDPQQCTIALAAVRSFGTEDRETSYPVPPQNQVYDYILFRGSDIKDIRVVNNVTSMPNDPAIMQLSVPNPLSSKPFQAQGFSHPGLSQMGQFAGASYNAMDALAPGMRPMVNNNKQSELTMPGPVPPPHLSPAVMEPTRPNENDLIGGGSRSTTPASIGSRKSSTTEQGTQAGGKKEDKKVIRPIQPPRGGMKDRRDSRGESQDRKNQKHRNHNQHAYHQGQGQGQLQQHHHQQQHQQQQHRQGNWVQRGPMRQRARGRPRGSGGNFAGPQGGTGYKPNNRQNQQGQTGQGGKPKITFDKEYDFEQANSQFEEMCGKLAKTKLDEGVVKPEVNGAAPVDNEKKDDSGNETGAGDTELEEETDTTFYDKNKSFFDNISCEAVERSKGRSQRTDWRTERKLNSETFGVASARRGSYRGRGGYRGGFRGGYRGGYRNNPQNGPKHQESSDQQQASRTNATDTVTSPNVSAAEASMTPVVVAPVTKTAPVAN